MWESNTLDFSLLVRSRKCLDSNVSWRWRFFISKFKAFFALGPHRFKPAFRDICVMIVDTAVGCSSTVFFEQHVCIWMQRYFLLQLCHGGFILVSTHAWYVGLLRFHPSTGRPAHYLWLVLGLVPDSPVPLDLISVVSLAVMVAVPLQVGLQLVLAVADLSRTLARVVPLIPHQRHLVVRYHDSQRFGFVVGPHLFPHPLLWDRLLQFVGSCDW